MPKSGTLRIPDMTAMERVTLLQQHLGSLELAVVNADDALKAVGYRDSADRLWAAWQLVDNMLFTLGLLGDTADLVITEGGREDTSCKTMS